MRFYGAVATTKKINVGQRSYNVRNSCNARSISESLIQQQGYNQSSKRTQPGMLSTCAF